MGVASLNKRRWRFARLAKRLEPDKALARKVKRVERMLLIKGLLPESFSYSKDGKTDLLNRS